MCVLKIAERMRLLLAFKKTCSLVAVYEKVRKVNSCFSPSSVIQAQVRGLRADPLALGVVLFLSKRFEM